MDPDDGAAKEVVEPVFASGVAVADVAGTRGNAFEENESDREPSKSISPLLEVVGAAGKKHKEVMSTKLGTCCLSKMTSNKTLRQALQNHYYQHQTTNVWK